MGAEIWPWPRRGYKMITWQNDFRKVVLLLRSSFITVIKVINFLDIDIVTWCNSQDMRALD
jgi:hypothetical protein